MEVRRVELLDDDRLEFVDTAPDVLDIARGGGIRIIVNMGDEPVALPAGEILVASDPRQGAHELDADAAVWLRT